MTAKPKEEDVLSTLLVAKWEEAGNKLAALAAEFPAQKFEHRPAESVRTFGEVLRHLAFWNQYVADTLRGKKANDTANELALAEYPAKPKILEALEQTSREVIAALGENSAPIDPKIAELVMSFVAHTAEHYGQLVVYTRLTGNIPPASR